MCVRRCPTFPPVLGSIIGAGRLSFRVRDGSGRFPAAIDRRNFIHFSSAPLVWGGLLLVVGCECLFLHSWNLCVVAGLCVSFRPVSASSLSPCGVYRSGLLIPWSAGGLIPLNG